MTPTLKCLPTFSVFLSLNRFTLVGLRRTITAFVGLLTLAGLLALTCPCAQAQTVTATVPVGSDPASVAVNTATNQIYVANSGSNTLSVISGATNTILATVSEELAPVSVAVNAATNQIYVANSGSNTVAVLSASTYVLIGTVEVGSHPSSVAVNPTTGVVYVANYGSSSVSVINGATNAVIATLAVGSNPYSVAFSPVTGDIYVANYGSNTVSVIDGSLYAPIATVNVGAEPSSVAVNSTTGNIYVANSGSGTVSVISPANAVIATVNVGLQPSSVAVNSATGNIYVANYGGSSVSTINGTTNAVSSTVTVGSNPSSVAVDAVTNLLYVANSGSNNVMVLTAPASVQSCTVNATTDSGATGDILYCVNQANAAPSNTAFTINFDPSLNGKTITLSSTLTLANTNSGVTSNIQGPGANQLTISGGNATEVFLIASGTVNISGLTIANGSADTGGAILNESTLTVSNSAFTGNQGSVGGAIANGGALTVTGCTFNGNSAGAAGGAIIVGGPSTATITNSTFNGNTALQGGALYVTSAGGTAAVSNSTISGNTGSLVGGGIYNEGALTLADDIVAGNTTDLIPGDDCDGCGSPSSNIIGTPSSVINPQLAALANYGGPTQTMLPLAGSPAFCVGTSSLPSPLTLPSTDQRGFPRTNTTYSGFDSSTPCVDVGAVQTNYQSIQFTNSGGSYNVQTGDSFGQLGVIPPSTAAPIVSVTENGQNLGGVPVTLTSNAQAGLISGLGPVTTVAGTGAAFSSLIAYSPGGYTLAASLSLFTPQGGQPVSITTNPAASLTVTGYQTEITLNPLGSFIVGSSFGFNGTVQEPACNASCANVPGSVSIYNGANLIGQASRSIPGAGEWPFSVTVNNIYLAPGTYPITAVWNGSSNYYASSSGTGTLTISKDGVDITSGSSPDPSTYSQPITLTATVTAADFYSLYPTGSVQFIDTTTGTALGFSGLNSSGQTSLTLPNGLSTGTHAIEASYPGDVNFLAGEASFSQTVNPGFNIVTFTTPPPASAEYGSSFTVAASGLGTGAITYTSDGVVCTNMGATYTMIAGSGTCTVTATQAADANYKSGSVSQSVTAQDANSILGVTLTSGTNPSNYGLSLTFTATITSDTGKIKGRNQRQGKAGAGQNVVGGTVTWSSNTGCGTTAVTGGYPGTATCVTEVLPVGTDTITAAYSGDANHNGATTSVTQEVTPSPVQISPASINFGDVSPNKKSPAKPVTLTNNSSTEVIVTSTVTSGEFGISSSTCAIVAAHKSCKIEVYFAPTQVGAQTGTLSITDNVSNIPQTVSLSGTGLANATLTPETATYAAEEVGAISPPKTFWLTNESEATLSINPPVTSGDFEVVATSCGASLGPKDKCWISVAFAPTQTGTLTGQLSVSDSASNSPQTSNLTGTGK